MTRSRRTVLARAALLLAVSAAVFGLAAACGPSRPHQHHPYGTIGGTR